jgi:DamX protein
VILLNTASQSRLQVVDLPPLAGYEIADYLRHRLKVAGYLQALPFTIKDLNYIVQQSSGKPSVVNQLAHQQLLGIKERPSVLSFLDLALTHSVARWSGVVIVVIALAALVSLGKNFSKSGEDELAETDNNLILQPETEPVATVDITNPQMDNEEQVQREELVELLAEIPDNLDEIEQLEAKTMEQLTQVQIIPDFKNEDWILQQDKKGFTFQLMGSWDRSEVLDYIKQYALSGDVAVFDSMRQDKVWYVLLYGSYKDKQQAVRESRHWPEPLNTVPTWLRRFDSVQQQIKDKLVIQR